MFDISFGVNATVHVCFLDKTVAVLSSVNNEFKTEMQYNDDQFGRNFDAFRIR